MSEYPVDWFIDTFSAIKEEKWCSNDRWNEKGQRCAYGHCQAIANSVEDSFEELDMKFAGKLTLTWIGGYGVHQQRSKLADINNGYYKEYQQPTPKQRTLAALNDIKKIQLQVN